MRFKLILSLILAVMAVLFIIQNVTTVDMVVLFWTIPMSRALLMFLFLSIGTIFGWLLHDGFRSRSTESVSNNSS